MSTVVDKKVDEYKGKFVSLFNEYESRLNGQSNHPFHQLKREGLASMEALSFPGRRDEDWKYTSLNKVLKEQYALNAEYESDFELPETLSKMDAIKVVFLNGILNEELSDLESLPNGFTLGKSLELFEKEGEQITKMTKNSLDNAPQSLVGLNVALTQSPVFFRIAKNVKLDKPVHFIYLTDANHSLMMNPQVFGVVEQGAEMSIVESFEGSENETPLFINVLNRFEVGANAKFSYYRVQNESLEGNLVSNVVCHQGADSTFNCYLADIGGNLVRNNLDTVLTGSNTTTQYFGVYCPADGQHVDNQTFIDHALPHCFSNEQYKGVVGKEGRGVFNGKVMVRQDAQKTNAFQQNSNLLLDETSVMDSKPQLEIFADDVKCSHGATIGQLDEASIFYLRSRGLSEAMAKSLLQYAFLGEVVDNFELEPVKEYAEKLLQNKLT
ncbi:MAG: Fe-S cluster assembly protein SufD [Saprospiraceae bacterium]